MLGPPRDSSVQKDIVPHVFHKLTVTFSKIYPSQYGYFDVGTPFYESHLFCKILNLQLSFYRPLYYNSRAYCPLLQCLCTTSAILAGTHSYFVVSSFKCEGGNSCLDLIPNPRRLFASNLPPASGYHASPPHTSLVLTIRVVTTQKHSPELPSIF